MTTKKSILGKKDFNEAFLKFIDLLETSPLPPDDFGFPIKDNNLMNMLYLMGLYESPESREKYWSDMQFLNPRLSF